MTAPAPTPERVNAELVRELQSLSNAVWNHVVRLERDGKHHEAALWMHRVIPARAALRRAKEES